MENININNTIWEEKNSTEVKLNCESNPILGQNDITNEIKVEFVKKECENIGTEKKWVKNCPKCGRKIFFTLESNCKKSIKRNSVCKNCSRVKINIPISDGKFKRNCPKCNKELLYVCVNNYRAAKKINSCCRNCKPVSEKVRTTIANFNRGRIKSVKEIEKQKRAITGRKQSEETKRKHSLNRLHITDEYREKLRKSKLGKKMSEDFRQKMREIKLKKVEELNGFPSFNPNACKFMDEINKKYGYNLQHALNGGEVKICGYSLDGYDKEKNIVFEYDEPRHENPTRKTKDLKRTEWLINKIGCDIIRYSKRHNKLYKSYPTYSEIL